MDGTAAAEDLYTRLIEAWNARDAPAMAAPFAPDGLQIGFDGSTAVGPAEIEAHLAPIFADHPTGRYVTVVRNVRPVGSDAMLLVAVAGLVPPGGATVEPLANSHQTVLAARGGDGWRVELFQTTPAQFHGRPELVDRMTEELNRRLRDQDGGA